LDVLLSQGAQWFFPFDDTDIVEGTTGLLDEDIGFYNTSSSKVSSGAGSINQGVSAFAPGVGATCLEQPAGAAPVIQISGLTWDAGVGGSMSFWFQTTTEIGQEIYRSIGISDIFDVGEYNVGSADTLRWTMADNIGGTTNIILTAANIDAAVGVHIGLTAEDNGSGYTTGKLYINGVLKDSATSTTNGEYFGMLARLHAPSSEFRFGQSGASPGGTFHRHQGFAGVSGIIWTAADFLAQYNAGS
jgi:hypothetical protein